MAQYFCPCVPWTHALNGWELKATCSNPIQFSGLQGTPHKLHFFSARDLAHAEGHSACSNAVQSLARPSQAKLQELGTTSNSVHGIINSAQLKHKRKIPEIIPNLQSGAWTKVKQIQADSAGRGTSKDSIG